MRALWSIVTAAVFAVPLAAQSSPQHAVGSATLGITAPLPPSAHSPMIVGDTLHLRITVASDGKNSVLDLDPGGAIAVPMFQGMHLRVIYRTGADSIHIGVFNPDPAARAPGMVGYRLDFAVPKKSVSDTHPALPPALSQDTARMQAFADSVSFRDLGRTSQVAGMTCEEWQILTPRDTASACTIPMPPRLIQTFDSVMHTTGVMSEPQRAAELAKVRQHWFNGNLVLPIRIAAKGTTVALVSLSHDPPPASLFEFPDGLQPLNGMLPFKMPGQTTTGH